MKEKWKDEQTSCSEEKGELKWPKQKNYIEMWRQGVTVTNGGHRQNGEDVSASLHLRCSPLLRLLRTWGFAHNDATNQKEAADEKFQSSTQSTLTQLSWNVTHIQSRPWVFLCFQAVSDSPPPLAGTFEDVSLCTSGGNLFKNRPRASTSEYKQPPINLRLFQNTVKFLDNFFLSKKAEIRKWKNISPRCQIVLFWIQSTLLSFFLISISTFGS